MTPDKAIRISTPSPEELQALYDLPSDPSEVDPAWRNRKHLRRLRALDDASQVECYNEAVRSIDALFEAATSGSDDAKKFLRTVAKSAIILGRWFM
ncbi:MAG: hypothetical protein WBO19_19735 [Terriglobia bacterium]